MLTATVAIAVMMVNAIKIPFALVIYTAPIPLLPFYFSNAKLVCFNFPYALFDCKFIVIFVLFCFSIYMIVCKVYL